MITLKTLPEPIALKIVIGGSGGVGKTTLIHRFTSGAFRSDTRITLGMDFIVKNVAVEGRKKPLMLQENFLVSIVLSNLQSREPGMMSVYDLINHDDVSR